MSAVTSRGAARRRPTSAAPALNIAIFALFVVITLAIVIRASRNNRTAADYYAGGRAFTGRQNGIAIAGDYLSAASFLGIAGAIAINGYDGFLYSIGFLVAWLVALLLVAELLRNTGRFTMADVLSFRLRQRPVRMAAAISTLVVSFFYLLAQMAGAGGLVALLLGHRGRASARASSSPSSACIMIVYVLIGGMKGTTWVQIIKAILLIIGAARHDHLGARAIRLQPLHAARRRGRDVAQAARPSSARACSTARRRRARSTSSRSALALVLGTAGLPHVLMRFYTVPTAKEARKSVEWAIWLIGIFYLFTLVLGYGAAALVGPDDHRRGSRQANSAAPLLAYELGGTVLLGIIAAVAFATILAVVAGLTITASASFAHDIYGQVIKQGKADAGRRGQGRPDRRPSSSASSRSSAASSPTARTSRSSWRWPSPSRRARTCRRSSTRCSGSGSTPGRAVEHLRRPRRRRSC